MKQLKSVELSLVWKLFQTTRSSIVKFSRVNTPNCGMKMAKYVVDGFPYAEGNYHWFFSFCYKIQKVRMVHLLIINDWVNVMKRVYHSKSSRVILFNLVLMLLKIIVKVRCRMSFLRWSIVVVICLATHNCIITEVKLYHSDGNEALPRK